MFDRMASGCDSKLARMAPINDGLYFLLESVLAWLPRGLGFSASGLARGWN